MSLLIRNLSQIASPAGPAGVRGRKMGELRTWGRDSVIVIREGRFAFVGSQSGIPEGLLATIDNDVDAKGSTAVPGFDDSHTHLPFAGLRESEFNRRIGGESYEEIAASGGGIAATVR